MRVPQQLRLSSEALVVDVPIGMYGNVDDLINRN